MPRLIPSSACRAAVVLVALAASAAVLPSPAAAQGVAQQPMVRHWIRYPSISPDGQQVAFSWRGDLWLQPLAGGAPRLLTSHEAYEAWPVWSPDSQRIAFASDRHGQLDVFVVPVVGGAPTRLTFHSADDTPTAWSADGERVFFNSNRQHAPQALLGAGRFEELYSIAAAGSGRPRQELTTPALAARPSPDGRYVAYEERTAYEDTWRKHQTSSAARDLWSWDRESGVHRRLTDWEGEDREPVWSADGTSLYFLSERDGNLDVWRLPTAEGVSAGEAEQVTDHEIHPVRFLSLAGDGTLAYGFHGEVWVRPPGGESRRLDIVLHSDERSNRILRSTETDGATEMAVSPHGDEVAFIVHGEIYVASADHGTTRRLTETAEQERSLSWAPDGRSLYFAGERGGSWNLYRLAIRHDDEDRLFAATEVSESPVLVSDVETFQPVVSPDGESIAYLADRDEIRLLELRSGTSRVLVPATMEYSYSDGDIDYVFSPDGRWLAVSYLPYQRWIGEIGLVEIATGAIHNVTESGYAEGLPRFSGDGETLYFVSDRFGMRSHGSWGSQADVMALSLTQEAWEHANLSLEEWERWKEKQEKEDDREEEKAEEAAAEEGETTAKGEPLVPVIPPVAVDPTGFDHRTRRLTLSSAELDAYVPSKDGEAVFYIARVDDRYSLWATHLRRGETRRLADVGEDEGGGLELSADGKMLFVQDAEGGLLRADVEAFTRSEAKGAARPESGATKVEPIAFRAELTIDRPAELAHLFEHVWRQTREKFYTADLHGADWTGLRLAYSALVPDLRYGRDFAELLSELLGELNASHTGGRYRPEREDADATASLGLLYDPTWEGAGLRIAEVLQGGPADRATGRLGPGVTISHLDGVELTPEVNPWALLDRKAGQKLRLTARLDTAGLDATSWDEVLEPVSLREESELRYEHWVDRLRTMTERLSGGRVGYVHVASMNDESFRRTYLDALGRMSDKEALILDTRWNGGGWLHDDLVAFLQGERYVSFVPRGKELGAMGGESMHRWNRPAAVLQNEANYSDGHFAPWAIQELGLAPLVGAPVAGTSTAVWWERLIDPALVFGIPQVGMIDSDGNYLENQELQPDVEVYNDPESVVRGEDRQLEAAVELLLEQLDAP